VVIRERFTPLPTCHQIETLIAQADDVTERPVTARRPWVIFDDLGPGGGLPVSPNDRKCRARSGASASGHIRTRAPRRIGAAGEVRKADSRQLRDCVSMLVKPPAKTRSMDVAMCSQPAPPSS
jgi:hypothetical protein